MVDIFIVFLTQILCIHSTLIKDFQMSIASLVSSCKTLLCVSSFKANVKTRALNRLELSKTVYVHDIMGIQTTLSH